MRSSDLLNLERQYTFYKSYHSNTINKRIHTVFVPVILITSLSLLSYVPAPSGLPPVPQLVTAFYIIYSIVLSPLLGLAFTPFLVLFYLLSRSLLDTAGPAAAVPIAVAANFIGWFAQIVGHYVFEGRSPAFVDSVVQAFLAAPIVIFIDAVFSLGFLPDTRARFMRARVAAMARKAVAKRHE